MKTAEEGINELVDKVDTLIVVPNQRLFDLCDARTGVDGAFRMGDDVLCKTRNGRSNSLWAGVVRQVAVKGD